MFKIHNFVLGLFGMVMLLTCLSCGPRQTYVGQQILGRWIPEGNLEPTFHLIKFNTNKTFDLTLENNTKVKGNWSTLDSAAALLELQVDEFAGLNGTWKVEVEEKKEMNLSSTVNDSKFQLRKQ